MSLLRSFNPGTGALLWEGHAADADQVSKAIEAAREAASSWATMPFEKRAEILLNYANILKEQHDPFAQSISQENGKPLWDAKGEVSAMINKVAISIEAYKERCRTRSFPQGSVQSITRFKPHGVVAVLGPFNFPGPPQRTYHSSPFGRKLRSL